MIGSVWNKWDLHIHSPMTHQANGYGDTTIEEYVAKLKEHQLSLVGITNYFYFEDSELEIIREEITKQLAPITVLGNIEFRINQQNKDGEWINVHCLFSQTKTTEAINTALSTLPLVNTTFENKTIYCAHSSMDRAGLQLSDAIVDFKLLLQHLSDHLTFGLDYLIAVCPNGYGGFRPDMKEGRSRALAIEIEKQGQIILARAEDRDFFLNNLNRYDGALPKPVFACSDAHSLDGHGESDNRSFGIGENYTWIKAKPTFEGLRQTLIEPDSRVQQTDDFTELTFQKPRFKSVRLGGEIFPNQIIKFEPSIIDLNPNMVAIIGGRGTGKSLFLDSMHSLFNNNSQSENAREVKVEALSIDLDQGDGTEITFNDTDHTYSYLHVSQGDIQKYSKEPVLLSDEIKRMLNILNVSFDKVITDELTEIIGKYRGFVEYWEQTNHQNERVNTTGFQSKLIKQHKKLIGTLTNSQNNKLIQQYQENSQLINNNKTLIEGLRGILSTIDRYSNEINQKINQTNDRNELLSPIPEIAVDESTDSIKQNIQHFSTQIQMLTTKNDEIIVNFKEQGINQDISSLLSKVSESQLIIDTANSKLSEIEEKSRQGLAYVERRAELVLEYKSFLDSKKKSIDDAFASLKAKKAEWDENQNNLVMGILSDIHIEGSVIFNAQAFYEGIENCINKGKFRSSQGKTSIQRLKETFNVNSTEDFFELIAGNKQINCEGDPEQITIESFFWKSEYFNQGGRFELLNYLFSPESIKNYLYVNAEFEYKGKTVDKLSVGQRGTFYVCLKLATDPFGSPFVFDQPEDDLDNEFIMEQLVPLFREIKKYRQVIIVTHNANLVVNTDAEQIIVASNEGEVISYEAGALEDGCVISNEGTRASICNILEGGSYAFEKRERKYGIQALVN
ncbi:TrlF family AAA-like ATPase [uncultured Paraglaciecola sp.]|uniref:TrlF family AAA-like ATPase n=1 Tax=uncultured Paraglaciecola sp. TaxID=1765024 RepID=UPI0030D85F57|tara:strand:+ start:78494 stop:81202 length:2709 start_codon:yes stop_codon:yes gene_type:complete